MTVGSIRTVLSAVAWLAAVTGPVWAEPPALPPGLGAPAQKDEPEADDVPPLPPGLGAPSQKSEETRSQAAPWWRDILSGFVEARGGVRTQDDPFQKTASIGEVRAQIAALYAPEGATIRVVGDFLYDAVDDEHTVDLEEGQGWFDLREANVTFRPLSFADVKIGRQILTWGTGDLVFINDLFPKDFQSFFIGRDVEYLKGPSDAVRVSTFFDIANLDVVYTPKFDPDRTLDGSRLSFFNPAVGAVAGRNAIVNFARPEDWFGDDEIAARVYRNIGSFETALYFYDGYWKSPGGGNLAGQAIYPDLRVIGASLRGPLLGGIINGEVGHYDSRDDKSGSNPLIQNSESRFLIGFEREALPELTIGVQYYAQVLTDYDALKAALLPGQRQPDKVRHTLTLRATKLAYNQNLTLSLFNFWSPNDDDGHLRLHASYKVTDAWRVEAGANVFYGPDEQTFFGQLKTNTNIFVGVRRSF